MAVESTPPEAAQADLRRILQSRDDVNAAFLDSERPILWVIGSARIDAADLEPELSRALESVDLSPEDVEVRCVAPDGERRVRLVAVERASLGDGTSRVRVTLAWQGQAHVGEAVGEESRPIEMRTAAQAALNAIALVTEGTPDLRLTGVKKFRAFDVELVAVSIHTAGDERRHLVGSVIETDSEPKASAMAVLNAVNRLLGNFLHLDV